MTYRELIERFEKYAEKEVCIVASYGDVVFFPVGDEDTEITHLIEGCEEPFRAIEVEG